MPQIRTLGAASALVAAGVMVLSSVASAHPGPHFGPATFDNVWVDTEGLDEYKAPEDSRDKIVGLAGDDKLQAGDKRDLVFGNRGKDAIDGGEGRDKIVGGLGGDRLFGGDQADKILGGPGPDGINGGDGRDVIKAGRGNDLIIARDGQRDLISCGKGKDRVRADYRDRVARDCEIVRRAAPTPEPEDKSEIETTS
jgi:Ca2+-binding RTX toxin-like protein